MIIYTNINKSSYCDKNYKAKENMYPIQSPCIKNQRMIFCCGIILNLSCTLPHGKRI